MCCKVLKVEFFSHFYYDAKHRVLEYPLFILVVMVPMDPSPLHLTCWIKPSYHQGWRSTNYVLVCMLARERRWSPREESNGQATHRGVGPPLPYGAPSFGGKLGPPIICCFPLSLVTWCCMKLLWRALQSLCIVFEPSRENTTSIQG
jgi:hypothetical protein